MVITKKPSTNTKAKMRSPDATAATTAHLHGASIIDARGREIPITETMIQRACQELIQAWERAHLQQV